MSNRLTSGIKRDNNPEAVWNSSEVNTELSRLSLGIQGLQTNLMTVNSNQVIDGQKTFFTLFVDEDSIVTYDDMMDDFPFDISPVFGASVYGFGCNRSLEEGRYNKKNASGTVMDVASLNPSFMPSEIYIEVVDATHIRVKALNVPLPLTSISGTYSESDSSMSAYMWKSSTGIEDTVEVTGLGTTYAKNHNVYISYIPSTDTTSIDLTPPTTQDNKILTRCIGAVFSKNSKLIKTTQSNGVIRFNQELTMTDLRSITGDFVNYSYNSGKVFDTYILKVQTRPSVTFKVMYSDRNYLPVLGSVDSLAKLPTPREFITYIPVHRDGKNLTYASMIDSQTRVLEIIFGDLLI